jgi:hypothetical protein
VGEGGLADFAHDAEKTLSADRWAMVGEACRFTDPLYSPGGDLISTYNTLVTDAILTEDRELLPGKVRLYEQLARSIYDAYVPSFAVSYDTLGDQEAFSLRYTWELTVYFAYYVFPMINDLFTDATFSTGYLRRFARLGPINRALHHLLAAYYHWKKAHAPQPEGETILLDFTESGHLRAARECFFKVGLSSEEGRRVLDEQLESLEEVARWIVSHVAHVVTGDRRALSSEYVQALDLGRVVFDPQAFAQALAAIPQDAPAQAWKTPPTCLARFGTAARAAAARATRPPAERSEPAEVPA